MHADGRSTKNWRWSPTAISLIWALSLQLMAKGSDEGSPEKKIPPPRLAKRIDCRGFIGFWAVSGDGKLLAYTDAVQGRDKRVTDYVLLDLVTGKELRRQQGEYASVGVFSADGKQLAVSHDITRGEAILWDVSSWKPKTTLKVPGKYREGWPIGFTPDGKYLVGNTLISDRESEKCGLVLWELPSGKSRLLDNNGRSHPLRLNFPKGSFDPVSGRLSAVAFSENEEFILFAQYGVDLVSAWDMKEGKLLDTRAFGMWPHLEQRYMRVRGCPVPGSPADRYRFRLTPSRRIVACPKYDMPPIMVLPAEEYGSMTLIVTPSGKEYGFLRQPLEQLCSLEDFKHSRSWGCRLTADGKQLVAAGDTPTKTRGEESRGMICIWDVSALHPVAKRLSARLSREERLALWEQLFLEFPDIDGNVEVIKGAMEDRCGLHQAILSQQAMVSLVTSPVEGVAWLRKRIGLPLDRTRVKQLVTAISDRRFAQRDAAARELRRMGPVIRPILEVALNGSLTLDERSRLEEVLKDVKRTETSHAFLAVRLTDVLEHIDTPAAHELLQLFAEGSYGDVFAVTAKPALKRRSMRP